MGNIEYNYKILNVENKEFVEEKYPVIIFNERQLPLGSILIDSCASGKFFRNIDDNLSKWFWKFTICVGVDCSEESGIVISHSNRLRLLILNNKKHVQTIINKYFDTHEATKVMDWWIDTLDIMIKTAKRRKISIWRGIPILEEK